MLAVRVHKYTLGDVVQVKNDTSILDIHNLNGNIYRDGVLVPAFGGHLVLKSIQVHAHVARPNVGRVLKVCGIANHGAIYPPSPLLRRWLFSEAACKALDPDISHGAMQGLLSSDPQLLGCLHRWQWLAGAAHQRCPQRLPRRTGPKRTSL